MCMPSLSEVSVCVFHFYYIIAKDHEQVGSGGLNSTKAVAKGGWVVEKTLDNP